MSKKGGSQPETPDMSGVTSQVNSSLADQSDLANQNLSFAKDQYSTLQPYFTQALKGATQAAATDNQAATDSMGRANTLWGNYTSTYQPMEQQNVVNALGGNYMSDGDRASLIGAMNDPTMPTAARTSLYSNLASRATDAAASQAGERAAGDVDSSYAQQARALARLGGDPTRMAAAAGSLAQNQMLARIGASNTARTGVIGSMNNAQATTAQLGQNAVTGAGNATNSAVNAAGAGVGAIGTALQNANTAGQNVSSAYSGAQTAAANKAQGALGLGGLQTSLYGTRMSAYNAAQAGQGQASAGAGQLLGMLGSAYITSSMTAASDRRLKTDVGHIGYGYRGLPIYSFRYVWGGPMQIGYMADEVERVKPEAVVTLPSGYQVVDYGEL